MTDASGYDPTMPEFYQPDSASWIETGATNTGWMYQKIADGQIMPLIVASKSRVQALTYRQYCEHRDGRPYSETVAAFKTGWEG